MSKHRTVVSTSHLRRNVHSGDLLLRSMPFCYVLSYNLIGYRCSYCFSGNGKRFRCSGCNLLWFCDKQCHKHAWRSFHKFECNNLKKLREFTISDSVLLMARILHKLNRGEDIVFEHISGDRRRCFNDLLSHKAEVLADEGRMEHLRVIHKLLPSLVPHQIIHASDVLSVYGKMCVNSYNILDSDCNTSLGVGLYLATSVVDHSCCPNVVATFNLLKLSLYALDDIPDFCWSKARISYIDVLNDRTSRRQELIDRYYFVCDCARCLKFSAFREEHAFKCASSRCSNTVCLNSDFGEFEDSAFYCDTCNGVSSCAPLCPLSNSTLTPSNGFSQHYLSVIQRVRSLSRQNATYEECKSLLSLASEVFDETNIYLVKVVDMYFECAISVGIWQLAYDAGKRLINGFGRYYGRKHPLYGMLLFKLGKLCVHLYKIEEARSLLREAHFVFCTCLGAAHPLVVSELRQLSQQVGLSLDAIV